MVQYGAFGLLGRGRLWCKESAQSLPVAFSLPPGELQHVWTDRGPWIVTADEVADPHPLRDQRAEEGGTMGRAALPVALESSIGNLEGLRWLEDLVAQDPRPGDPVTAWLNPSVALRLDRAGVPTLSALIERINGIGARAPSFACSQSKRCSVCASDNMWRSRAHSSV
nr:phage integrase family protein [Variovorax paradoxus]